MSHTLKVVFVHGWGMNSAVWQDCIEQLPEWMQLSVVDLPGHGTMSKKSVADFDSMVAAVAAVVTGSALLVGWSLGGLVCMRMAELYPEKVSGLCLVASNPCFVKTENWQNAIDKNIFDEFSMALKSDIEKTIKRFLVLQVAGSDASKATLKKLQLAIQKRGSATSEVLDLGLDALSNIDLRKSLKEIDVPVQWVLGSRDTLIPAGVSDALKSLMSARLPVNEVAVIEGAAHAPFLSHEEEFNNILTTFASGLR